jgi:hypothetical protein
MAPHCEFRAMTCQVPTSKLYQPCAGFPAAAPKYAKYPAASALPASQPVAASEPVTRYSWFPGTGRMSGSIRPHVGSKEAWKDCRLPQ